MEENLALEGLSFLTSAKSKSDVTKVICQAFRCRNSGISDITTNKWAQLFSIKETEVNILFNSIIQLISHILYNSITDPNKMLNLFPKNFHEKVKKLIIKTIINNYSNWKVCVKNNTISSVPKLIDFEWRLDIKKSSSNVSLMNVPTVMVSMLCQQPQSQLGIIAPTKNVEFELTKESLGVMVNGLTRIREQLKKL